MTDYSEEWEEFETWVRGKFNPARAEDPAFAKKWMENLTKLNQKGEMLDVYLNKDASFRKKTPEMLAWEKERGVLSGKPVEAPKLDLTGIFDFLGEANEKKVDVEKPKMVVELKVTTDRSFNRDGTVEDYIAWVTGKTSRNTARESNIHSVEWAIDEIARLREMHARGEGLDWFASPEGIYYDVTKEIKEAADKILKEKNMATATKTPAKKDIIVDTDDVKYNADKADKGLYVPQGMTFTAAKHVLELAEAEQNKVINFSKVFDYRPDDGAHAAHIVLKRLFGTVLGKSIITMFGEIKPEQKTIKIGHNKTATVPWGRLGLPTLDDAIVDLGYERTNDGPKFVIEVQTPKRHKAKIDELFAEIEKELKENSIYRGHALVGAFELEFIDVSKFDPSKIVFSDEVEEGLEAALFNRIRHPELIKAAGLPIKSSVLLHGPFGTGKTSVGQEAAQVAEANGWTFLQARTGQDRIEDVLKTAKLYQPAVVLVEDIGEAADAINDRNSISSLLETFDGVTSKDTEIIMVLTTNHAEAIHKGMWRPGRIDVALEINGLDRSGVERLLRVVLGNKLGEVDFDEVYPYVADWQPAWIKSAADRSKLYALSRADGLNFTISTHDLVEAAKGLKPQHDMYEGAREGAEKKDLATALEQTFENSLHKLELMDPDYPDGSVQYTARVAS